ncbi:Lrp/AsnC family transcriptional regulator [Pseudonocardia oroxyli]|uniref:DNA-binding transcriptional regulator, Lrp family n=1 Tax=Pseudonocardia oroxyli TaxID=366584 RepID=A0A1G7VIH0_PSEOR|nr:Lrp/AsnC family transcriptional regulator [Pseudonocardia oroxyli]SDG58730.1 DNA-binding transcriptional regulator, Lrp family [Pseudonocardia oroxyli]
MSEESSASTVRRAASPNDVRLDPVDRAILRELELDARIPNNALAERVGVAPSTCLTRVRSLRERGVIRGFHADVDPAATGRPLQAMVSVRLQAAARRRMREFEDVLTRLPEVRACWFLAGVDDYLLNVAAADSAALRDFVVALNSREEVANTQTSLIFEQVRRRPANDPGPVRGR